MEEKMICKCGNDKFVYKHRWNYCMQGAGGGEVYACTECGEENTKMIKGTFEFTKPQVVYLDTNELELADTVFSLCDTGITTTLTYVKEELDEPIRKISKD